MAQLGTQELYDLLEHFERAARSLPATYIPRLDREDRSQWRMGHFYQDGNANMAFQAFHSGYMLGRLVEHQEPAA